MRKAKVYLDFPYTLSSHRKLAVGQLAGPIVVFGMPAKSGEDID